MSIYLFWDKYDRLTTYKSFFEAEYRLLTPELSSRDYEHIIATKLCEDLADDFLNALKLTMIRIFELLETSYTSELYLCSQKRLIKFMENVLQYIKIERIYLSYLEYPLKTGVPAGENTLINSLLRFRSLLKDFKTIFGFNSSKEIEDFENAKELIGNFANYFKLGFGELKSYCVALKQQNPYAHELMLINEVLTTCDELKYQPQPKYVEEVNESMMSKSDDFDGLSAILGNGNSSADYKTQLKNVMETTSGKPDGLSYKRLEPEYLMKASYDPSSIARESTKRTNGAGAAQVTESESKSLEEAKYDFYKYDKEFKDNKPPAPKGKQAKEQQPKEEISVFSILNKGRVGQDKRLFNTLPETQKKTVASQYSSSTVKNFPLTHYLDRFRDDENTELLALVNIDFDPHHGMKLTTNAAQQAKLKQRAEELEERIANSSDRNPRLTEEEQRRTTQVQENSSFDGDEDIESDSDLDDLDLRDRRMMLERRRRNLNTQTDMEFHQLPTGLHGEPTLINNYAFYENTLLKYEKPTREYLKETETVLERPTVAVDEIQSDFAFRESSPRSSRRKFLANVFGPVEEEKIFKKYTGASTRTVVAEIANNKGLRPDELEKLRKNIEVSKGFALEKARFARESVEFFSRFNQDNFKICEMNEYQRKQRMLYLWNVLRDFLSTRVFYKKVYRKSAKADLDALTKIKSGNLMQHLFKGQDTLIFHRNYTDPFGKEKEFVVLNRLMGYKLKLDYVLNFDRIIKPTDGYH